MLPWKDMFRHLYGAALNSHRHGVFATAKAAAYSASVTLFPAFIVIAWVLSATNTTARFIHQITDVAGWVVPPDARDLTLQFFAADAKRPVKLVLSASFILLSAATGVMMSLMEGFRKAYGIYRNPWSVLHERVISVLLVFLGFAPMMIAMSMIAFSRPYIRWFDTHTGRTFNSVIFVSFMLFRWVVSGATSVTVIMLIYHWGLPRVQSWKRVLPGAILSTMLWFPVTVTFGWYVNNYANYAVIYGPLGAGIALLVWMYLISTIILYGAEFNALICPREMMEERRAGDRRIAQRRQNP